MYLFFKLWLVSLQNGWKLFSFIKIMSWHHLIWCCDGFYRIFPINSYGVTDGYKLTLVIWRFNRNSRCWCTNFSSFVWFWFSFRYDVELITNYLVVTIASWYRLTWKWFIYLVQCFIGFERCFFIESQTETESEDVTTGGSLSSIYFFVE